jgi:glycosyltransferase involved in cell wall biosynthesis
MTRILYIGSGTPWVGGAGYLVRQSLFLRALAEVADELHLAMFDAGNAERPPFAASLTRLPMPGRSRRSRLMALVDDRFSREPRMMRGYNLQPSHAAVAALHPADFDAVFAFRIDFAYFAGVLNHPRLILDIDDPEHVRQYRRIRATTGGEGDHRTQRDLLKLRQFEHNAVAQAKLAFVCQSNDSQGWPIAPLVVPNCVDVPPNPPRRVTARRIIFVGNCTGGANSPNVDAVQYFLAKIWPKILSHVPDAEFRIIGATSDAVQQLAAKSQQVQLAGFVSDLSAEYAEAAISIAPIRFGTGTRIKILEAFAHACPVVSTLPGADGIAAIPGREIELTASPGDLVSRCIHLLKDADLRERIGQGGHALARRLYDSAAQHPRIVALVRDFLATHPAPTAKARAPAVGAVPEVV